MKIVLIGYVLPLSLLDFPTTQHQRNLSSLLYTTSYHAIDITTSIIHEGLIIIPTFVQKMLHIFQTLSQSLQAYERKLQPQDHQEIRL